MPSFPESTYRLQFHKGFTFRDAARIVPYLRDLGVTHVYASPYFAARPGSTHGYDVIDHCRFNPELGGEEGFRVFVEALKANGLEHILDVVPNHVGVATNDNLWWNDVLENGPASIYGTYFDIAWRASPRPELHDKVLIPTLGAPYADVLEQGQLKLSFDSGHGSFAVSYYDRRFPISPRTYDRILGHGIDRLTAEFGDEDADVMELLSIITEVRNLPDRSGATPKAITERHREKEVIKHRLATLVAHNAGVRSFIEHNVATFNGMPGEERSFDLLDNLLEHQCYRLSYWHVASDEINYRRFFDINDLAALSMERREVFEATHSLVFELLAEGTLSGLRIDHPDGLYDPEQYFARLQREYVARTEPGLDELHVEARADQRPLYVVAEKILAHDEPLPRDWAVHGTSGYDFLNVVNGLFVDSSNEERFTYLYDEWIGSHIDFDDLVYRKKLLILDIALSSELHMLAHQLDRLAQRDRRSRDFTLIGLTGALKEVIACFPVYRSYITAADGVHESDQRHVERAVECAIARNPKTSPAVFHFIRDTILQRYPHSFTESDRAAQLRFAGKFQQVTAPVTAKGIEDTAFYIYNRFVSLNEVGGEPSRFGNSPDDVHAYFTERQRLWPHALSALSTHDTKRSEDVRARLNVLSEIPDDWRRAVTEWRDMNARHQATAGPPASDFGELSRADFGELSRAAGAPPNANEEYLLYQTLVGAYPLDLNHDDSFVQRIQSYMQKAMREAKLHTSWIDPNPEHESAVSKFIASILSESTGGEFLASFRRFGARVARHGLLSSLAQTLLKLAAPGVPDTYQGTESWDFSFVDPDNRRPVDYDVRRRMLAETRSIDAGDVLRSLDDGRAKLLVTARALAARRDCPGLFSTGEYLPAQAAGERASNVFAFVRRHRGRCALCVVPRLTVSLLDQHQQLPIGRDVWRDTRLVLPPHMPRRLRNVFTGQHVETEGPTHAAVAEILAEFPIAMLVDV